MNTRNRAFHRNLQLRSQQAGATLVEILIGLALSMVVTSSMVVLMSNSMGSATRIIQMSQLTDELRNTMSMLTRDIRRANYSANAAFCYANSDCGISVADGGDGSAMQFADIDLSTAGCVIYGLDRNWDGNAATDDAGGFRLRQTGGGIGFVEMWTGDDDPGCGDNDAAWIPVTDPEFVDITNFVINNADSFNGSVSGPGGSTITQWTRQVQIDIEGRLIRDRSIVRRIQDEIKVRNDLITTT